VQIHPNQIFRMPYDQNPPPQWSRGDLVKVRLKMIDIWRDAFVLIQRRRNLLLVIPEGMIGPDGTRHTRLPLIAEKEPRTYRHSLNGVDDEVKPSP